MYQIRSGERKGKAPKGAKLWSPSALSGSDVITLALRLPSAVFPGPESKNFMMVDTMLRAVFTMALVLVTMLLHINCTPPVNDQIHFSVNFFEFFKTQIHVCRTLPQRRKLSSWSVLAPHFHGTN